MRTSDPQVRSQILDAAERLFAERGYAGTSVQDIIDETSFSKPVLYYHFGNKASLYKTLVDSAYDETHRLMVEATAKSETLRGRLVEILRSQFEFMSARRSVIQIVIAAAFAAPGEMPDNMRDRSKGERNFELIHSLVREGMASGELTSAHTSLDLAFGIYGALSFQVMVHALIPGSKPGLELAEQVVDLFLNGALARGGE